MKLGLILFIGFVISGYRLRINFSISEQSRFIKAFDHRVLNFGWSTLRNVGSGTQVLPLAPTVGVLLGVLLFTVMNLL